MLTYGAAVTVHGSRLPVHVPAGTCVTGGTPCGPRLERMRTLDSALGPNLQQTTKEGKLPMTARASSLGALLLERSDG